jgi:Lrp/AsnC family transcriptional regulator, leucine-responsive regulatory protein
MDAIDRAILRELQRNGRIPNAELADRVHLSPSPCLRRVKRLEAEGTISGYRAVLDKQKLGLGLTVFTEVKIADHSPAGTSAFQKAVADTDEIIGCYFVSGSSDLLLETALADLAAYEDLYFNTLSALPGVLDTETRIVMRTVKEPGPLPVRD